MTLAALDKDLTNNPKVNQSKSRSAKVPKSEAERPVFDHKWKG